MIQRQVAALQDFILNYGCIIPGLSDYVERIDTAVEKNDIKQLVEIYDLLYPLLEQQIWSSDNFDEAINFYHALFREQEGLTRLCEDEDRYDFIVNIPINDDPGQVKSCLDSIYQQCVIFAYGGRTDGIFNRVQVVIVEDSPDPDHQEAHQELAELYTEKGLRVHYYSLAEQYRMFIKIPRDQRNQLTTILTDRPKSRFYHKGTVASRNLGYLKCLKLTEKPHRTLYYMIDSDRLFRVNRKTVNGDKSVIGINYFYYLNRIFIEQPVNVLSAGLVGVPSASIAAMAVDFIDDMLAFFSRMASCEPDHACDFHSSPVEHASHSPDQERDPIDDAGQIRQGVTYQCGIEHSHNNLACFIEVASRLEGFFRGDPVTRYIDFIYSNPFTELESASNVCTGNFIANHEGLKQVIPFGYLHLRRLGDTAGQLIRAKIGDALSSANLSLLNQPVLPGCESSRPIDLSVELERQFFGDLMFLVVQSFIDDENFNGSFNPGRLKQVLQQKEQSLLTVYQGNLQHISQQTRQLTLLIEDSRQWWHSHERAIQSLQQIGRFIGHMEQHFSEDSMAWKQIQDNEYRQDQCQRIADALLQYRDARDLWGQLIDA